MANLTYPFGSKREMFLLLALVVIGIAGLVALQLAQRASSARPDERTMVQSAAQKTEAPAPLSAPIQRITGDLVNRDEEYPEVGQPFTFRLTNYSQGAVFELDLGDGSPRRVFKDGQLRYTYKKAGDYQISLWAKYKGEEVKLKTITKKVKVPPPTSREHIGTIVEF
ncbi:MAG: hypothetical protein RMJ33_07085 [Saprospiraceae bacterium]|nr:DUF1631 domain-containing protein [Saprospiraceae bacterium]MDW8229585.1 hypothetical protein [Saprospiraceae bacterium]